MKLVVPFAFAVLFLPSLADAAPASPRQEGRVAVLVGANQAIAGRQPLRYAYRDAEKMADILTTVGDFDRARVHVLRDPDPRELLAVVQREIAAIANRPDTLFYFYYSGHADEQALYPSGKPLYIEQLRAILDDAHVALRIGLLDACRGGSWTRTKGLSAEAPFAISVPINLANEGSVFIASSSGLESAHESDAVQGSFFTYHFAAGLRGAADKSQNGEVTLGEAFDYAKEMTIRDTARYGTEPQHPSYAVNLRGRQDLVLAQVSASPSTVEVNQR